MSTEIHVEPAHDNGHSGIGAHSDEEETQVLHVRVIVDGDEDTEACDGDGDRDERECEAVLREIRAEGYDHRKSKRTRPGRNAVELRLDGRVAVG